MNPLNWIPMTDDDWEQMRKQNLKKYPKPKKLSIREVE